MPRPKKPRRIAFRATATYFKPRGIPLRLLDEVILLPEEVEAIRLRYRNNLEQIACAKKMRVSQPTFQRILSSAHKKIASAIVQGKAIRIDEK